MLVGRGWVSGLRKALRAVAVPAVVTLGFVTTIDVGAFCELMFKDVAEHAAIVVLVEYRKPKGAEPYLHVAEVLKGATDTETLRLGRQGLRTYKPAHGDRFLLALTVDRTLVGSVFGMGSCVPRSVLAVGKGKVRAVDRSNWDGTDSPPTLDRIREHLAD